MIPFLFALSIAFIPFSDIHGLPWLGEMKHEFSTHLFLITLGFACVLSLRSLERSGMERYRLPPIYGLPRIYALLLGVVVLSFIMNLFPILESYFRERSGINKFATSTLVLLYGFGLATLAYFLAVQKSWESMIIRPVALSVILCALYSAVEMTVAWTGSLEGLLKALNSIVHSGSLKDEFFGWVAVKERLRSVSFEPPAFANYAGFAWPWLYAGSACNRGLRRLIYLALWIILSVMIVLSASRTGLLMMVGSTGLLLLLRFLYLPPKPQPRSLLIATAFLLLSLAGACIATILWHAEDAQKSVVELSAAVTGPTDSSGSNLTRLASNVAASRMFLDNPFFGLGFGQYGFYVTRMMPPWGYYSWEIQSWFRDPNLAWPPVFSLYARFAAELGLVGLLAWIGVWVWLMQAIWQVTRQWQEATGVLLARSYPLLLSCFVVLLSGVPSDTLRTPMMWITLGIGCRYVYETRKTLASTAPDSPSAVASTSSPPLTA